MAREDVLALRPMCKHPLKPRQIFASQQTLLQVTCGGTPLVFGDVVDVVLLGDGQDVVNRPVDDESCRKRKEQEGEDNGEEHHDFLLPNP